MTTTKRPRTVVATGEGKTARTLYFRKLRSALRKTTRATVVADSRLSRDSVLEALLTIRRAIRTAPSSRALRPIAKEANLLGTEVRKRRAELRRVA